MNKRIYLFIGAGIVVVALLAGGAFMAMRLLNKAQVFSGAGGPGKGGIMQLNSAGGPGGKVSVMFKVIPAPELPKQAADMRGMVVKVKDNSVFVAQTDNFIVRVENGVAQPAATPSGPSTEVVIAKDTRIYRDATMDNVPENSNNSPDNPTQIQQKLEPVDLAAITANTNTFVAVWGQRRGDRLNAEVVVVSGLEVKSK